MASIWKVRSGLRAALRELVHVFQANTGSAAVARTDRNLPTRFLVPLGAVGLLLIVLIYYRALHHAVLLTVLTTALMLIMAFFFSAVASYIVGLVGNSNSPVSGMTITAVLGTGLLIYLCGYTGTDGIVATLGVAGVVCCVACTSGDVCNDLKTGQIVGATPASQQWMQILGVVTASFVMAPVLTILHEGSLAAGTGGIGGSELPAPQAGLFAALTRGFFEPDGQLPYRMVAWGGAVGLLLLLLDRLLVASGARFRLHLMPVAVGIYLPFGISVPILLGGLTRLAVERMDGRRGTERAPSGVLIASGMIAGESLLGVALGLHTYCEFPTFHLLDTAGSALGWSSAATEGMGQVVSTTALLALALWLVRGTARENQASGAGTTGNPPSPRR